MTKEPCLDSKAEYKELPDKLTTREIAELVINDDPFSHWKEREKRVCNFKSFLDSAIKRGELKCQKEDVVKIESRRVDNGGAFASNYNYKSWKIPVEVTHTITWILKDDFRAYVETKMYSLPLNCNVGMIQDSCKTVKFSDAVLSR